MASLRTLLFIGIVLMGFAVRGEALIKSDREISQFDEVWTELDRQTRLYGPDAVLLVLDLDNTTLHSRNILGSYAWYKWQEKMILSPASPQEGKVTDSMAELFLINGLFFSYGSMELSDAALPAKLATLKKQGLALLCLTSRSPGYWEATLRDLQKNGLSFASPRWQISELAYERDLYPSAVLQERFQLSETAIKNYGLTRDARIMLRDGVFFSSGLHKAALLDVILKLSQFKPKALVFVDDSDGNLGSLRELYQKAGPDVFLYRYARYDAELKEFATSKAKQTEAIRLWNEWQRLQQSQDIRGFQAFLRQNFP